MKEAAAQPANAAVPAEAVAEPKQENGASAASKLNRTFAAVPVASGAAAAPAEALLSLVRDLASKLGIRADQIRLRVDHEAQMVVTSRDAEGVARSGVMYLRSENFDPTSRSGRRVVAHEAAHIAQSLLPGAALEPAARTRVPAEIEADVFADQYTSTRTAARMKVPLPPEFAAADKDYKSLVESAGQSRKAEIDQIVSLLSYGLFDWAITDTEVFDVLQIFAMYPMAVARAIAHHIEAKYRERLLSNLNPPHYAAHRREILAVCWAAESEDEYGAADYQILQLIALHDLDPLEAVAITDIVKLSPKMKDLAAADATRAKHIADAGTIAKSDAGKEALAKDLKAAHEAEEAEKARYTETEEQKKDTTLDALVARIVAKLDEIHVSDDEALELLDAVSEKCLTVANPADRYQALARKLGSKTLDSLIDQIPAHGLYVTERRRKSYVYLVATRAPFQNLQIADNLMSSPWWQFWDTVTSEEAFLAYLLVKSMPAPARTAFLKGRGGERWGQVVDELPENIRESASFNFYQGGTGEKDRQGVFIELIDPKLWTAAQKDRLDATIRIARAAGEMQFVFEQSKVHKANDVEELKPLVTKYGLYARGERELYREKALEGHAWHDEGIIAKFKGFGRLLILAFGAKNVSLGIIDDKVAADVDLNALHAYGGVPATGDKFTPFVRGARFHETTGDERKASYEKGEIPLNVVRGEMHDRGEIVVNLPNLLIDQLALAGDTTVTAAPVACKGLYISAKYTPDTKKPISLSVKLDEFTLSECAIVKGDAIYSINSLKLTGLDLQLTNAALEKTEDQAGVGAMFSALLDPKQAQGVTLSFTHLEMNGVATSGGFFVQKVEIAGLNIQAAGDAGGYVDAMAESLKRLTKRILEEEKAEVDDAANAAGHAKAKAWLVKQRDRAYEEQKKGQPHGSVVDIRSIKVTGIPGIAEGDEPLVFDDVHGQGQSVTAVVPLFADPTSIRNLIRGTEAAPTMKGKLPGEEEFTISIRDFKSKQPLRLAGGIPTKGKARAEFDEYVRDNSSSRFKEGYRSAYDALKQRAADVEEYEALAARGVQNLKLTKGATERFSQLRRSLLEFEERRALIIETLAMEGITLNISGSGNPELIAETLSASGIQTFTPDGRQNLKVGKVTGQGVSVSAAFTGGLANAKDWRKNLQSASLKADQLTLTDIEHQGSGAIIKELTFEGDTEGKGLEATLERNEGKAGGASLGVKSRKVIAKGVSIPAHAALLRAERRRILAIPEGERSKEELKRLTTIDEMLGDLEHIQTCKASSEEKAATTKSNKEKASAQKQIAKCDDALKEWEDRLVVNKLTIEQLDISISGLGDVLSEGYSFNRDAPEWEIEGRGKDGHIFEKTTLEGVHNRTSKGDQVVADKIEAGPAGGKLKKLKDGYALEGFTVASLAVRGVTYVSGATTVQAIGESKLLGISISATYKEGKGESELTLTHLRIERIVADNLKYEDGEKVVTVVSGELIGLDLSGMHVTLPEYPSKAKTIEGTVKLDAVKNLALGAVASGYQVDATLNAAKPKPEGGKEAHALTVSFAKSGEITVGLRGLSASADVRQLGTNNKVHIEWKNLGGTVIKNGDNYTVKDLSVGSLTLSRLEWLVGTKTITIEDKVTLSGISLDVEASLQPKQKAPASKPSKDVCAVKNEKDEPEKELSKLLVKKLVVNEIDARQVRVKIPEIKEGNAEGLDASPMKAFHLEHAVIKGLTVTGFDVLNMQGKVEVKKSVAVTNLRATIGDIATKQFKVATASFTMFGKDQEVPGKTPRELSATLMGKDGTIIKLGRTDSFTLAGIWTSDQKTGKKGSETTETRVDKVSLKGITTGDLIIKDDFVEISDIEVEGPVGIVNVNWEVTGASKQKIHMDVATLPEVLKIGKVRADFKKEATGKIVKGKEVTRSKLHLLTVSGIKIPKLHAMKLNYQGPLESDAGVKTVELNFPTATINGIDVTSLSKDFTKNLLAVDAKIASTEAGNFTAKIVETIGKTTTTKTFGADITTGEIRANAVLKTTNAGMPNEETELDSGYFELDGLGLRHVTGKLSDGKGNESTIGYGTRFLNNLTKGAGVDVAKVRHDKGGTKVSGTSIRGVTYNDPSMGLSVDVQEMVVPEATALPKGGLVTIPEATVTNAFFHIDNIKSMLGGGGGGGGGVPTEQFYQMLDHVNGHFKANIYLPLHLDRALWGAEADLRQDEFPIDTTIKNGKFNYSEAFTTGVWARNRALASLQMDTDATKEVRDVQVPDWSQSYLTLEVFASNVFEWTPEDDKEREEMTKDKEVRLKRIIRPDDKDTAEEKKEKEKEKEEDLKKGYYDYVKPEEIELRGVDANLGLSGYIPLDLGPHGKVALGTKGGNAMTDLKLDSITTSKLKWTLKQMAVTVEQLNLGKTKLKGDKPGGAEFVINGVEGGSLEFENGKVMNPTTLEGTITNATVKNLAIDMGK